MQHLGTEDELQQIYLEIAAALPPEKRLAGLSPAERLAGLSLEERLAGLSLEELVQGLTPEELEQLRLLLQLLPRPGDEAAQPGTTQTSGV